MTRGAGRMTGLRGVRVPSSYASFLGVVTCLCTVLEHAPQHTPKGNAPGEEVQTGNVKQDGLPVGVRATATGFPPADSAHSLQDRTLIRERQKRTDTEKKTA